MPCDLLDSSFTIPGKFHAVMMVHTIREWSKAHVQRFFRLIFNALHPGGVVFMDMLSRHAEGKDFDKSGGPSEKGFLSKGRSGLYFLVSASQEQYHHTVEETSSMLQQTGFTVPATQPVGGYLLATKPAANSPALA
eukprot:6834133-Prymnesium_polylepis.1